ncbi:hypothetical protein GCM10008018_00150 [Paenibacillus marchantiophytorum]|uniref:Uncharacterized protein n=1 Tax=Paenibacillus marchantiophytorum TaxID=1619310 RepID=A0ABQ2BMB9_9BACL|nr:hypothetical protein [Paenibacillus marchantiophytorum]GGI43058.1 hypothetical protein GCM10008018_00150 [Paenibacillus marchantiophytorum]
MKFKKITLVLAAVSALAFGAQSAFAQYDVNENPNANNSWQGPASDKVALNYGVHFVGTLSSSSDEDWSTFTPPNNTIGPGSYADITLVSPPGYSYNLAITDSNGGYVAKTWLQDSGNVAVVRIYTEANRTYWIGVTPGSSISTWNYQLTIN